MKPYYEDEAAGITIYHGDSREIVPGLEFDLVVTDPPYGISHSSNHGASWMGTSIVGDQDTSARDTALALCAGVPALVFGTWRTPPPKGTRAALVWDKGPASGMGDLSIPWKPSFELIYVLGKGFSGPRDEGVLRGLTGVTWESKGRKHPHEKPVRLLVALITKCPPGLILDPFMGSGTTLRAAKDLGRRAIGVEVVEKYCEIAAKRLAQQTLFPPQETPR